MAMCSDEFDETIMSLNLFFEEFFFCVCCCLTFHNTRQKSKVDLLLQLFCFSRTRLLVGSVVDQLTSLAADLPNRFQDRKKRREKDSREQPPDTKSKQGKSVRAFFIQKPFSYFSSSFFSLPLLHVPDDLCNQVRNRLC